MNVYHHKYCIKSTIQTTIMFYARLFFSKEKELVEYLRRPMYVTIIESEHFALNIMTGVHFYFRAILGVNEVLQSSKNSTKILYEF